MYRAFGEFPDEAGMVRRTMDQFVGNILAPYEGGATDIPGARENLELMMERTRNAILALPVIPLSQVFEDGAPLEFYPWLRAVCSTARSLFALLHPYVSPDVFHGSLAAV